MHMHVIVEEEKGQSHLFATFVWTMLLVPKKQKKSQSGSSIAAIAVQDESHVLGYYIFSSLSLKEVGLTLWLCPQWKRDWALMCHCCYAVLSIVQWDRLLMNRHLRIYLVGDHFDFLYRGVSCICDMVRGKGAHGLGWPEPKPSSVRFGLGLGLRFH